MPSLAINQSCLMALPANNAYQTISDLVLPETARLIKLNSDNTIVLLTAKQKQQISFQYQAQALHYDWSTLTFKRYSTSPYFNQDQFINRANKGMQALAKTWTSGIKDPKAQVRVLYQQTLDYLTYGLPIEGLYPYSQALENRVTDCGGFATFLATLLQIQGIPARLVVGYLLKNHWPGLIKQNLGLAKTWADLSMHAWLECQLADGSWLALDPAVAWRLRHDFSQRKVSLSDVPADRLVLSFGHNHHWTGAKQDYHWPILQKPLVIPDVN